MVWIITGTPGTGKSTLAQELGEEFDRSVINITGLLRQRKLDSEWDDKRQCFLVDVERLTEILEDLAQTTPDAIIDGHLSHYLSPQYVDRCIVTKCDLAELKRRLEERGYDEDKIRENLDCEIFDVCHVEATEYGHNVEVVYTDGSDDA